MQKPWQNSSTFPLKCSCKTKTSLNPQPQGNRRQSFRSKAPENLINPEPTTFRLWQQRQTKRGRSRFPSPNRWELRSIALIFKLFVLALLAEFAVISVALFRLVAATVDLRVAVDEVLDKLAETETELRQVREDLIETKSPKALPRRERQTMGLRD